MEGQSLLLVLFPPPPFHAGRWAQELLAGRGWCISCPQEGTVWLRKTVRRAATAPLWAPSLMACHLLNVRTKELILAVTGLWGWGSGVTLELVLRGLEITRQRREERPLVRRDGDMKG